MAPISILCQTIMDPFSCFGDDSDDDDDNDAPRNGEGKSLAERFNSSKLQKTAPSTSTCHVGSGGGDSVGASAFRSSYDDQVQRTSSLPWQSRPPLYYGPMNLCRTLAEGGNRGYIASEDLPPGTCVLVEEPIVAGWSDEQMGKQLGFESVRYILENQNAREILHCMEELHPRREAVESIFNLEAGRIEPIDKVQIVDMMSDMTDDDEIKSLLEISTRKGITNSDGTNQTARDVKRLLLALRYNGFDSGLYLNFAMFNHSEDPSCTKFRPTEDGGESRHYSEARTVRHVRKGEALTISYLENPREVSHATRRKILWDQHRFDIGDEGQYKKFLDSSIDTSGHLFNNNDRSNCIFEAELVADGSFPLSSREGPIKDDDGEGPLTTNIEHSLDDLEDMLMELKSTPKTKAKGGNSSYFDQAAALELTLWELNTVSQSRLENKHHILLSRCRRLHLDAIELFLTECSSTLKDTQLADILLRAMPNIELLLESQTKRLGRDHPDVARTNQDFANAIQVLLSSSPKRLLALKLKGMETLNDWSRMEHRCRLEKKRIESLYPRDVDDILESVKKP